MGSFKISLDLKSLFLFCKSVSLSGKCYLYLNQREYISCEGQIDDVKGLAYIPDHALSEIKGEPFESFVKLESLFGSIFYFCRKIHFCQSSCHF